MRSMNRHSRMLVVGHYNPWEAKAERSSPIVMDQPCYYTYFVDNKQCQNHTHHQCANGCGRHACPFHRDRDGLCLECTESMRFNHEKSA